MGTSTASQTFDTLSDLRSSTGIPNVQALLLGLNGIADDNGGMYRWDALNTSIDDGFKVVQVAGVATGRWMRVGNSNTVRGTVTFSALSLTSSYMIAHGIGFIPAQVYIQAKSPNAAVNSWVNNINATTFTVNFASVPVLGTNNITIDWQAFKV